MNRKAMVLVGCLLALSGLSALSGCADQATTPADSAPRIFYQEDDQDACVEMLLEGGTLQVNAKGCLVVVFDGEEIIPLWPAKPKVDSQQITLPNGATYRIGEKVKLPGGGGLDLPIAKESMQTCEADSVWKVCGKYMH